MNNIFGRLSQLHYYGIESRITPCMSPGCGKLPTCLVVECSYRTLTGALPGPIAIRGTLNFCHNHLTNTGVIETVNNSDGVLVLGVDSETNETISLKRCTACRWRWKCKITM